MLHPGRIHRHFHLYNLLPCQPSSTLATLKSLLQKQPAWSFKHQTLTLPWPTPPGAFHFTWNKCQTPFHALKAQHFPGPPGPGLCLPRGDSWLAQRPLRPPGVFRRPLPLLAELVQDHTRGLPDMALLPHPHCLLLVPCTCLSNIYLRVPFLPHRQGRHSKCSLSE